MKTKLDSDDIIELSLDASLNRPSRLTSPEAVAFRKEQERFIAEVKAKGGTVEIPYEHPMLDEDVI